MAVVMETLEANKPEDVANVEEPKIEDGNEEKEAKGEVEGSRTKRSRKRTSVTPVDRPNRDRKTVERYTEWVSSRSDGKVKEVSIEQGPGTQLKDIPNVAYNLSKRKPDETLKSLHCVLFNKLAKSNVSRQNIGLFSGYVWADDERAKQREKVKEKLDRYVKEKLVEFCDILNIQNFKSSLKKEEVVSKLVEFLESPCVTTNILLAEKEEKTKKQKAKKRKSKTPSKKQKGAKSKRQLSPEEEDKSSQKGDDSREDDDKDTSPGLHSDDEENEEEEYHPKKKLKSKKRSSKKSVKRDSGAKTNEKSKSVKKKMKKEELLSVKDNGSVDNDSTKAEPTNEELNAAVVKMLKEADFDNVTVSDIFKQLGTHFGMDLTHRKAEAKAIITDTINNMADVEDTDS